MLAGINFAQSAQDNRELYIFVIKWDTKNNFAQILMFNICSWQPRLHTCTLIVHLLPNCMLAVLKHWCKSYRRWLYESNDRM